MFTEQSNKKPWEVANNIFVRVPLAPFVET